VVCHQWASTCYINLSTKFKVSIFTGYKDMKGDAKCGKCVDLSS